jgi:hypothetical protein
MSGLMQSTTNSSSEIGSYKTYRSARVERSSVKAEGTRLEFAVDLKTAESVSFENSRLVVNKKDAMPYALRAYRVFENSDGGRAQLVAFRDYAQRLAATGAKCYIQGWIVSRPAKTGARQDFRFGCIAQS